MPEHRAIAERMLQEEADLGDYAVAVVGTRLVPRAVRAPAVAWAEETIAKRGPSPTDKER